MTENTEKKSVVGYTFGILAPYSPDIVRSPYLEDLIASIMEEMLLHECRIQWIMIHDSDLASYKLQQMQIDYGHLDGLIVLCWRHFAKLIKEISDYQKLPTILINDHDQNVPLSSIYCDNKSGVEQIWNHFMERGFKTIGMAKGPEYVSPDARERFEVFKECAQTADIPLQDEFVYECSRFDEEAGYHMMRFWLQKGNLPEAIFCANDDLARGSIMALKEKAKSIPQDIAIAGFDDSKRNLLIDPSLTTARQPLGDIGRCAVQTLIKVIHGEEKSPVHKRFEAKLIVRKST